jgi:RNA recognition motif-containing protein
MSSVSGVARGLHKLFVANLPWTIGSTELKLYFSKFGHVHTSSVIYDKMTGLSKGYGFIAFSTKEAYNSALNKQYHALEGRSLAVQPSH